MKAIFRMSALVYTIYKDRRLLINLTVQDFKRRFAGSYLGMLWGVVNPLFTMLVYWIVFQYAFGSNPVGDVPFVLWFMCGMIPWLFFSEAFSSACNSFLEYSYLVKKVVFNINILPLVKIFSSILTHAFFIILLSVLCMCFGYMPSIYWFQLPYYLVCVICFLFAITLALSSIIVFFRDFNQLISVMLLVGMWGTPIAWNAQQFSTKVVFFLKLNPMYYVIEGYRDCFINNSWFWEKGAETIYFWVIISVIFLVSASIFNNLKHSFADFL